jgi:hypothetical protein
LDVARHHDHQCPQRVRSCLIEAAGDRVVDPHRQVVDAAIPAQRDRPGPRDEITVGKQVKLEIGSLLRQPSPVAIQNIAVVVVLG